MDIKLEDLMREQFSRAKYWWGLASLSRFIIVVLGAVSVFFGNIAIALAVFTALLSIGYILIQWHSDHLKGIANNILRKVEMHNGLGWAITGREISEVFLSLSKSVKNKIKDSSIREISKDYYSSKTPQSPKRLLENLVESAWLTKHQASRMSIYVAIFSISVVLATFFVLALALSSALNQATGENIAKVAISVFAFVFSGGYVRLAFEYSRYSRDAERLEERANNMLTEKEDISENQAIKLLHDYQIVRAGAPLLPDWLWKMMETELNELWLKYRQSELA